MDKKETVTVPQDLSISNLSDKTDVELIGLYVTVTLNTGEKTQFDVNVYELNMDDGNNTVTVSDVLDKGVEGSLETVDITIDIPLTTPDGDDTITVTLEKPEGTPPLEEGENNINASVTIDNITIVINIEGLGSDNPFDGLHQTVEEVQAMGFTFSPFGAGLNLRIEFLVVRVI